MLLLTIWRKTIIYCICGNIVGGLEDERKAVFFVVTCPEHVGTVETMAVS